jgi:TonB family protein
LADIFLSYSRKDRTIAASLAEILRSAHGWTLYWDRQLLAGEVFDDVLEREIAAARCVVVLWSSNSITSQWVRNEADEGVSRKLMVSVRIEDVRLPMAFRRIQAADLIGWRGDPKDERLIELVQAIAAILGGHGNLTEPAVQKPAAAASASAQTPAPASPVTVPAWPQGPPSERWLAGLKHDLAGYLGPVASIVVSRALRESGSLKELTEKVSGEIPNESERRQFLKSRGPQDDIPGDLPAGGAALKPRAPIQVGLAETEGRNQEVRSQERFGQARQEADAKLHPEALAAEGMGFASSTQPPSSAALQEAPEVIAARQRAEAVQQMVESATALVREKRFEEAQSLLKSGLRRYPDEMELRWALDSTRLDGAAYEREQMAGHSHTAEHLAVEHPDQASSQTRVTPAVAWSTQTKALSIAGAVIAVLAGGWLFHSFSNRQPGNLPVSPAPVSPAKVQSAGSAAPAKTVPLNSQAQATPSALEISPAMLSLTYQANAQNYPTSQVNLTSMSGPVNFSVRVAKGDDWLTVKPSASVTPAVLKVSYHSPPGGALAVGSHIGELRCETDGGQIHLIPVNLTVRNAAAAAPLQVDSKVMDGLLIQKVVPVYPEVARSARVQGMVEFTAVIGKDGSIQSLLLVRGHPLLVKAAEDAVKQFRYKPTLLKGQPVEVTTHIVVNFTLKAATP